MWTLPIEKMLIQSATLRYVEGMFLLVSVYKTVTRMIKAMRMTENMENMMMWYRRNSAAFRPWVSVSFARSRKGVRSSEQNVS